MTALALRDGYQVEIAALRAQLEEREEELRQLREAMQPSIVFPSEWRLTKVERLVLLALASRPGPISKASMRLITHGPSSDVMEKIFDVYVCKLRKKLGPFGIEIETVWAAGYRLTEASRAIVLDVMARERAGWAQVARDARDAVVAMAKYGP